MQFVHQDMDRLSLSQIETSKNCTSLVRLQQACKKMEVAVSVEGLVTGSPGSSPVPTPELQ